MKRVVQKTAFKTGILYCGDCLDILPTLHKDSVHMVFCDPPYGTTSLKWDTIIPFNLLWSSLNKCCTPNAAKVFTASQPFTSKLILSNEKEYKYNYVWVKNVPTGMAGANYMPMKYHEDVCVFVSKGKPVYNKVMEKRKGKGKDCYNYEHYLGDSNHVKMKKIKKFYDPDYVNPSSVLLFNSVPNRSGKLHPTQKPVNLIKHFIKTYTNLDDVVLDPTCGSGSTAIAAIKLKRRWICIEKDPAIYRVVRKRIQDYENTL
jgi:site-specific DNA-methyltransferase (adenine-specific)